MGCDRRVGKARLKLLLLLSVIGEFKSAPEVGYALTSEKDGSILHRASVKEVDWTYDLKTLQAAPGEGVKRTVGIDFIGAVRMRLQLLRQESGSSGLDRVRKQPNRTRSYSSPPCCTTSISSYYAAAITA